MGDEARRGDLDLFSAIDRSYALLFHLAFAIPLPHNPDMQALPGLIVGVAALGIGFGVGTVQKKLSGEGNSTVDSSNGEKAITFEGRGLSSGEKGRDGSDEELQRFGIISFTSYSEAALRLTELLAKYDDLSDWEKYRVPMKGELILEEIEGIVALANESELLDFIRNTKIEKDGAAIAEIAYSAFAKISPQRAAAFWLEIREGMDPILSMQTLRAVMRVWTKRNSPAAEQWVDSLADEKQGTLARDVYISMIARSQPEKVLAELEGSEPGKYHSGTAMILGQTMEEEKLAETADFLLKKREDGSSLLSMLAPFLTAWGDRNSDEMVAWLFSQNPELLGSDKLQGALWKASAKDPEKFLNQIPEEFATNQAIKLAAGQAWWKWLATEGAESSAFQWLGENAGLSGGFEQYQVADRAVNSGDWTADRTARVLEAMAGMPDSDFKAKFSQDFFERLGRYQPETVLPFAMEQLPLSSRSDSTIAQIVGNWARMGEPEKAVRWSLKNLEDEGSQDDAIRFSFGSWAEADTDAAAQFAMTMPEELRGDALSGISYQWAEKDPDGVIAFLENAEEPQAVSTLTRNSFRHFAEEKGGTEYFQKALKMPPGKLRHDAVKGLFGGWALSDAKAGADSISKVPEGSLRNVAIQGFNSFAARRDPALAIDLATQISNAGAREKELIYRGKNWMKKNPKEAEKAIRGNTSISDKVKAQIFK